MSENIVSTVSTAAAPVKFSGAYAAISTDVYVFLTLHCGVISTVAVKVANDAASAIGRVMIGVSREVSFGRMSKDLLSNIKETASRKGVSVNEFPLQCAYLAEKVRKFEFDNKVKIGTVELPESLAHYLYSLANPVKWHTRALFINKACESETHNQKFDGGSAPVTRTFPEERIPVID